MKLLRAAVIAAFTVGMCAILVLVVPRLAWDFFLRDMFFTSPPPSALNPPIYPKAERLDITDTGTGSKTIMFETPDRPEDVLAFYRDVLLEDRWVNPLIDGDYPENVFEWHQGGPNGPTDLAYRLTLEFAAADSEKTKVVMYLVQYDPRYETPWP